VDEEEREVSGGCGGDRGVRESSGGGRSRGGHGRAGHGRGGRGRGKNLENCSCILRQFQWGSAHPAQQGREQPQPKKTQNPRLS
jgi:hypothetical protein